MSQISVLVDPATGEVIDKASGRVVGMAGEGHFARLAVLPAEVEIPRVGSDGERRGGEMVVLLVHGRNHPPVPLDPGAPDCTAHRPDLGG